jgi:hypothetical protein
VAWQLKKCDGELAGDCQQVRTNAEEQKKSWATGGRCLIASVMGALCEDKKSRTSWMKFGIPATD